MPYSPGHPSEASFPNRKRPAFSLAYEGCLIPEAPVLQEFGKFEFEPNFKLPTCLVTAQAECMDLPRHSRRRP